MYDVIIIGGGASGLTVANVAKSRGKKVIVLECDKRVGKKILVAGNGKCNIGNKNITADCYNNPFVEKFLAQSKKTEDFFRKIGLTTRLIEDRTYPYSESGGAVLNLLRKNISDDIVVDCRASDIERRNNIFVVNGYEGKSVAVCTGGITGGGVASYSLLEKFGHEKKAVFPVLTALQSDPSYVKSLAGVRVKATLTLFVDDQKAHSEYGELLFKDNGLSGIVSMSLSRYVVPSGKNEIEIDFAPEYDEKELEKMPLEGLLQRAVGCAVERQATERKIPVSRCIKHFSVKKITLGDGKNAQVTRGGIATDGFTDSLESKSVKGLYACGEVLDVDGKCGGYNLHWAFLSGIIVGERV